MSTLSTYLGKPFPTVISPKKRVLIAFSFATTIYLLLLIFKPFNIAIMDEYFPIPIFLFGYWLTTFCSFILFDFVLPQFFKAFYNPDKWTLGKNIIEVVLQISVVGFLNFLYDLYLSILVTDLYTSSIQIIEWFVRMQFYTVVVGSLPTMILFMMTERILQYRNQIISEKVVNNIIHHKTTQTIDKITIPSNNKNESLSLFKQQLLCIKAEGNYANVFYVDEGQVKSMIIRNTLTTIITDIEDMSIKRCQISYIVNFDKVTRAYGNAKNINLQIEELDFEIPVSRKFPIKEIFNF